MLNRWLKLAHGIPLALLLATHSGCERYRQILRNSDPDVIPASSEVKAKPKGGEDEPDSTKVLDVQSDVKKARPFFRPSRLSGALTDEGREIERDLGIH